MAHLHNAEIEPAHPKDEVILDAIDRKDALKLAELARQSDGLLNAHLRAKAWPILMDHCHSLTDNEGFLSTLEVNDSEPHKDEDQVLLDIKRLFTILSHFNSFSHEVNSSYTTILSQEDVEAMRKRLYCLIVKVLRKYPCLHYYQGFHDVASIALMVCNDLEDHDDQAFAIVENLALYHLRDFMNPHMGLSINHLKLVPLILEQADPALFQLVRQTSSSYTATYGAFYDYKFFPALLALLTMYSHDVLSFNHVMRVWDFIFSYGAISVSAYIYASFILHSSAKICDELGVKDLEELSSADADLVHKIMSPTFLFAGVSEADLNSVLDRTASLISQWPLVSLFDSSEMANLWFREFNTESVVVTSSKFESDESDSSSVPRIISPSDLPKIVDIQEEQQTKESLYESELFQRAIEQDSLATSVNSLDGNSPSALSLSLLTNSLSNLTAVSSSINSRLSYTSSVILKKLSIQSEELKNNKPTRKETALSIRTNIYKLSLTIGLIGFILHFLLKHSDVSQGYSSKSFYSLVRKFGTIFSNESFWNNRLVAQASKSAGDFMSAIKDSEFSNWGRYLPEVGLGSVRKSVFALEKMTL